MSHLLPRRLHPLHLLHHCHLNKQENHSGEVKKGFSTFGPG